MGPAKWAWALFILLGVPSLASAQPFDDPTGDVELVMAEASRSAGRTEAPHIDLVGLVLTETSSHIGAEIQFATRQDDAGTGLDVALSLRHGTIEYRARVTASGTLPETGKLERRPVGATAWEPAGAVAVAAGADAAIVLSLDRSLLTDADLAVPFPGRVLEDIHVVARTLKTQLYVSPGAHPELVSWQDRLPDRDMLTFPISLGEVQANDIVLSSPRPTRGSNGEATQYVFDVQLHNRGLVARDLALEAVNVPKDWAVSFARPLVHAPAGGTVSIPTIVGVPFAHAHGAVEKVSIRGVDMADGKPSGFLDLGVTFFEIPQPSGHHPAVYIHALGGGGGLRGAGVTAWANSLSEDPESNRAPIRGESRSLTGAGADTFRWCIPLSPALAVGIDVDLGATGVASLPLSSEVEQDLQSVEVAVIVSPLPANGRKQPCQEEGDIVAAQGNISAARLGPTRTLEIALAPQADADHLATEPTTALYFLIEAKTAVPVNALNGLAPILEPGGSFVLPLADFHDALPAIDGQVQAFRHDSPDVIERSPGTRAVLRLDAEPGVVGRVVAQPEWARVADECPACVAVVIEVPATASPGETMQLIVIGEVGEAVYLSRFTLVVVAKETVSDALPAAASKTTPGVPVAGVLALFAVAFAQRARNR